MAGSAGGRACGGAASGVFVPLGLALACASTTPAPAGSAAAPARGIARYLPLEDNTVLSYETSLEPDGERGVLVLEIRRPTPSMAELIVAGRGRRLTVSEHAVAHPAGGFLLREPLSAGQEWRGDFGHVRVTRTGQSVTVGAGTFKDCVETVEELATREGEKRTTTLFCPGVGITVRETEAEQGAVRQTERMTLKSYGPKFGAGPSD
jgi:hypothetical protein